MKTVHESGNRRLLIPILVIATVATLGFGCSTMTEEAPSKPEAMRAATKSAALSKEDIRFRRSADKVVVSITGEMGFPPTDSRYTLKIGETQFSGGHYPPNSDFSTILFELTSAQFDALKDGDTIEIDGYPARGAGDPPLTLEKSRLEEEQP